MFHYVAVYEFYGHIHRRAQYKFYSKDKKEYSNIFEKAMNSILSFVDYCCL